MYILGVRTSVIYICWVACVKCGWIVVLWEVLRPVCGAQEKAAKVRLREETDRGEKYLEDVVGPRSEPMAYGEDRNDWAGRSWLTART